MGIKDLAVKHTYKYTKNYLIITLVIILYPTVYDADIKSVRLIICDHVVVSYIDIGNASDTEVM